MFVKSLAIQIKRIEFFIQNIYRSTSGLIKIIVLSKYNLSFPKPLSQQCIILGNGPSLKEALQSEMEIYRKHPLISVNFFAATQEFSLLKPVYHVLHDPAFFMLKNRADITGIFDNFKKVDWELTLFIPYLYRKNKSVVELKENSKLKISFYNYTVVKGFEALSFPLYKKNLAMPQVYNVLGASIFLAINIGYKTIWIKGADHSWFKEMSVDEENRLYVEDKHFYDKGKSPYVFMKDPYTNKNIRVGDLFMSLHLVFDSYYLLDRYAKSCGKNVFNASEFSYIDAFERKPLQIK